MMDAQALLPHTFLVQVIITGDHSILQGTKRQGTGLRFSNDGCAQDLIPYNRPTRLKMITVPSVPESLMPRSAAAARMEFRGEGLQ